MFPKLVLSDDNGNIFVHPTLKMLGWDGYRVTRPGQEELVSLPSGSTLFYMPHHAAIGFDQKAQAVLSLQEFQGRAVYPVSAFMIPGFLRLYLPAAKSLNKDFTLPLWPYTAVGWEKGRFCAAAIEIDKRKHQRPYYYRDQALMKKNIGQALKKFPRNRLFKHLSHCALVYNCRNAQNLFFKRWEAPLPVSPACNARCLGCISFQACDDIAASHQRLSFVPTAQEAAEVALSHIAQARQPIVSFGQGCEGEPLLQWKVLRDAIVLIRRKTQKGTIHLNTNGFNPSSIRALAAAGLDSVRISLNSFSEAYYQAYYRPRGYGLKDVLASIAQAKKSGLFVSLNLLMVPGFSDNGDEMKKMAGFLKKGYVDMLQLRNLSIDPEFFIGSMPAVSNRPLTIYRMISLLKKDYPLLRLGYFNVPKEAFSRML